MHLHYLMDVLVCIGQGEINLNFNEWDKPLNEALPNIIKNGFQFFQNRVQVRCSNLSKREGGEIILANPASNKPKNSNQRACLAGH